MPAAIHVNGTTFHVASDPPHPFWTDVNEARWEVDTFRVLDYFLNPLWRFVDIGAWIGPTALYAGKRCHSVEAYECDPVAITALKANLALNPNIATKFHLHEHALGDEDGLLRLYSRELGNSETSIFSDHERSGVLLNCEETILCGVRNVRSVFRDCGLLVVPEPS